jgi:hypothetical protein
LGTADCSAAELVIPFDARLSPPMAEMAIGTSSTDCSRRWAVTTITSCAEALSLAPSPAVCARAIVGSREAPPSNRAVARAVRIRISPMVFRSRLARPASGETLYLRESALPFHRVAPGFDNSCWRESRFCRGHSWARIALPRRIRARAPLSMCRRRNRLAALASP